MCGIAGFWGFNNKISAERASTILTRMNKEISHRGPDSHGQWFDHNIGLGFGHQRLSIIDLSEHGHQPMSSKSGNSVIIYNGEIYNALEIKQELIKQNPINFRGHSDTEIILEACEAWGVEKTLKKANGMFAFALWSKNSQTLTLARDRIGIKPLYWGINNGTVLFGSQLKSLKHHPDWQGQINTNALHHYFQLCYIPAPRTIYQNIYKLAPGSMLTIKSAEQIKTTQYWCPRKITEGTNLDQLSIQEQIQQLDELLSDAIQTRMVADVPLGAFLSGGIDSSTVAALMQKNSTKPIKTFSIGFDDPQFNESNYAKLVAQHLGTDHHEAILSARDALEFIPNMQKWYDEPFADSSQIPTYLVSQMAKNHVTVALSGDGGDELFAGYSRYHIAHGLWSRLNRLPGWSRTALAKLLTTVPTHTWDQLGRIIPASKRPKQLGNNAHKMASIMHCNSLEDFYKQLVSCWQRSDQILLSQQDDFAWPVPPEHLSAIEKMQWLDSMTYLPDDILTKVDRASMAVSLEARVPLLDYRVIEFAWQLPHSSKIKNGQGKWLLRQVLKQYVPEELYTRPKMGFGIPLADWLRGPLKEWASELLHPEQLNNNPFINAKLAQQIWQQHQSKQQNNHHQLWTLLMFLDWHQHWHSPATVKA